MSFSNFLARYRADRWLAGRDLLLVGFFGAIGLIFTDYGATNDEDGLRIYGNAILLWYGSFFQDDRVLTFMNLRHYGGFFEIAAQIPTNIALWLGYGGIFETRHFVNALFALAGLFFAGKCGALLGGSRAGFLATLFLLLTPRYFGHGFNNPKDLPFAVTYLALAYYGLRIVKTAPRVPRAVYVKFGLALGLALGVRIGAVLFLVSFLPLLFFMSVRRDDGWSVLAFMGDPDWRGLWLRLGASGLLAWIVMLIFWPAAQISPVMTPINSLLVMSQFPWDRVTFFNGAEYAAGQLPWYYLPVWYFITLPEFYFLAAAGLLSSTLRRRTGDHGFALALLALTAFVPVALALLRQPVLYDGMRHFLFTVPPLAVLAAWCADGLLDFTKRRYRVLAVGGGLALLLSLFDIFSLHPYQTVYFNRMIAGGLPFAATKFETDYWGNANAEAVRWIKRKYPDRTAAAPLKIASCDALMQVEYHLNHANWVADEKTLLKHMFGIDREPIRKFLFLDRAGPYQNFEVGDLPRPDILLATTRFFCHEKFPGEILHTVERKGVPLMYIIRPEPLPPRAHHHLLYTPLEVFRKLDDLKQPDPGDGPENDQGNQGDDQGNR